MAASILLLMSSCVLLSHAISELNANSVYPDQTPHSAASDLGLHCLHMLFYGTLDINGLIRQFAVTSTCN